MAVRWTTIVVAALVWGSLSGAARADWTVRRSSSDLAQRWARVLVARPEDAAVADRIAHELGAAATRAILDQFRRRAEENESSYAAQLGYAQLLLACGRWSEAEQRFDRAAALVPDAPAPRLGRARAFGRTGDGPAAVGELRAALTRARGPDQTRRVSRELEIAAIATGDIDAEIEARRARARVEPANPQVRLDLASALARAGRASEAAAVLADPTPASQGSAAERARWSIAEARYRVDGGDLAGAAAALDDALARTTSLPIDLRGDVWDLAVEVARRRGMLDQLKGRLAHPRDLVEWTARARICEEQGNLLEARAAFDRTIRLAPRDLDLRRRRIAVVKRIGHLDEIAALYEDLADAAAEAGAEVGGNDVVRATVEALDETWRIGRRDIAGRIFDRALAREGRNPVVLRALAEVAGRWADDRRAIAAWTMQLRRDPRDEVAIVALGEAQFQRGQRRLARETWHALLRIGGFSVGAHMRVGELLLEHDLDDDAIAEARAAMAQAPNDPGPHRLLATIFERRQRAREAEDEWQAVLRLARGPGELAARRAARGRLVSLWSRRGPAQVDARLAELARAARDGGDQESLEFLIEAELRSGRTDDALASLERFWSRNTEAAVGEGGAESDREADLILLMVRALRQAHRPEAATAWLKRLAERWPARARDALLQLADIALGEHADARAEEFARQALAASPNDGRALLRVAAVQERLGRLDDALVTTARAANDGRDPEARLAHAALLTRLGRDGEQGTLLRQVLRDARDDDVFASAGRLLLAREEAALSLDDLETFVAELPAPEATSAARARLLVAILGRVVPEAYRNRTGDARAAAALERFARQAMRPVLDAAGGPDAEPDVGAIEILGMLGRPEAVPVLVRLVAPDPTPGDLTPGSHARAEPNDAVMGAAVVALGRLGGDGARAALETAAAASRPALRLAVTWALGRVGGAKAMAHARQEIARGGTDAVAVACLALGRAGGPDAVARLASVIQDAGRPLLVRRAAVLGLGLGREAAAVTPLLAVLDGWDPELASTAGTALGLLGRTVSGESRRRLSDALRARAFTVAATAARGDHAQIGSVAAARIAAAAAGLEVLAADGPPPDEARDVEGSRIEPESLLRSIEESARGQALRPAPSDATPEAAAPRAEIVPGMTGPPAGGRLDLP